MDNYDVNAEKVLTLALDLGKKASKLPPLSLRFTIGFL